MLKSDEELQKEIDALSDEAMKAAEELSMIFKRFPAIETGEAETDEEKQKLASFQFELDRRRAIILRRLMIEFAGFLFI